MRGPYTEPLYIVNKPPDSLQHLYNSVQDEDENQESVEEVQTPDRRKKSYDEKDEAKCDKSDLGSPLCVLTPVYEPIHKTGNKVTTVPELELRKLERGRVSVSFPQNFMLCFPFELLIIFFPVFVQIST